MADSVREAVEHLLEDVDELLSQDLRLHDLARRIGEVFLGYGGGYNHEDDLRQALAGPGTDAPATREEADRDARESFLRDVNHPNYPADEAGPEEGE